MTVSAGFYPPDHLSSLFNLGALFGFRKDTQPTWRYEAPTLQQRADTLDRRMSIQFIMAYPADNSSEPPACNFASSVIPSHTRGAPRFCLVPPLRLSKSFFAIL